MMHASWLMLSIGAMLIPATALAADAAAPASTEAWAPLRFLLGEWVAVGDAAQGAGGCTFALSLDDHVMIRNNWAMPALKPGEKSALAHRDMLVIAPAESGTFRASYWDNEGHVITYTSHPSAKGSAVLVSDGTGMRFRLTYAAQSGGQLSVDFAMAAPGATEFQTYVKGMMKRRELPSTSTHD